MTAGQKAGRFPEPVQPMYRMEQTEFGHIVADIRPGLLRQAQALLADPDEAEDAVQDALLKLWQLRTRFADAVRMQHFAAVVVRNTSISVLRRHRQQTVPMEEGMHDPPDHTTPLRQLEMCEARSQMEQLIRNLPDRQRAILRMRHVEQLSYADIAAILGTSQATVRALLSRARNTLLKQFKDKQNE